MKYKSEILDGCRKGVRHQIFTIPISELDLCPIKVLVGQAGGLRTGKTFSGIPCRRDFAANLD
jgi:hypothetical protein